MWNQWYIKTDTELYTDADADMATGTAWRPNFTPQGSVAKAEATPSGAGNN